jgi:hypothetical protein
MYSQHRLKRRRYAKVGRAPAAMGREVWGCLALRSLRGLSQGVGLLMTLPMSMMDRI